MTAALLIGGCPKRQTTLRLVYVPAPPPSSAPASTQGTETMVIAPPPPPEPIQTGESPQQTPSPSSPSKPLRAHRRAAAATLPLSSQQTPDVPQPSSPALNSINSPHQEAALEKRVGELEAGVHRRIGRLASMRLSSAERKTLQDAGMFLAQAEDAGRRGDLLRSVNLVEKADLLIGAIEKGH